MENKDSLIHLTELQRLVLYNQYTQIGLLEEIARKLPGNGSDQQYPDGPENATDVKKAIVEEGIEVWYTDLNASIFADKVCIPKEVSVEVDAILNMHLDLIDSYFRLGEEEKKQIEFKEVSFGGFDDHGEGNHGAAHHTYACFLVNTAKGFGRLFRDEKGKTITKVESKFLKSHGPVLESYRKMLGKYKDIKADNPLYRAGELPLGSIQEILKG